MKKKVVIGSGLVLAAILSLTAIGGNPTESHTALAEEVNEPICTGLVNNDYSYRWIENQPDLEGYSNISEWFYALKDRRAEFEGISDEVQKMYSSYIKEDEIARLDELEQVCLKGSSFAVISENEALINELIDSIAKRVPVASGISGGNTPYYSNGQWLTKSGGVFYGPSGKETYYSSKRAYHYRTSEWTIGEDGVYRDKDGYVVVALPSGAMGTIVETSHGTGKCYDTNAGGDSVDLYVAW